MRFLKEDEEANYSHIYVDDSTGDYYIFDGEKLVKLKKVKSKSNSDGENPDNGSPPVVVENPDNNGKNEPDTSNDDSRSPNIGDRGNEDEEREEDERREEQARKEREEEGDTGESEEEYQDRLDKIRRFLDDKDVGNQVKGDSEEKVKDERDRKKAAEKREIEKNLRGAARNMSVIKQLSKDISKFLAKEIGKSQRTASWRKYNGNYDGSGIIKPGNRYEQIGKIPVIQIYIDQSGSWSEEEVKIGKEILQSLMEFERKKQIKSEIYYFANHIHSSASAARDEGGTGAGTELMEQLNTTKPDNVVVITDSDFDSWGISGTYTAPGGVWLVFREARSQELMKLLHGKLLTRYYDIDKV